MGGMAEEELRVAVAEVLGCVQEDMWEQRKLEKRVRDYFRKAAKGLDFETKPWHVVVNEYADFVFASLFQALGDRAWLSRADFVLALDAAVRDAFPARVLEAVPREDLERAVLAAHDRAFEEQRFFPMLWLMIRDFLPKGGRTWKKVYDAFEAGRRAAMLDKKGVEEDPNQVKAFLSRWIDAAIAQLSRSTAGDPSFALPEASAVKLLHGLLAAGALPMPLLTEHGPPPRDWPFVAYSVHAAYVARGAAGPGSEAGQGRPQAKPRPKPRPRPAEVQEPAAAPEPGDRERPGPGGEGGSALAADAEPRERDGDAEDARCAADAEPPAKRGQGSPDRGVELKRPKMEV